MRNWINFRSHHSFGPSSCDLPVFAAMLSRRKWPLDKYCSPKLSAILLDIVPFPDPGGPIIAARNNLAMSFPRNHTPVAKSCKYARVLFVLLRDGTQQQKNKQKPFN